MTIIRMYGWDRVVIVHYYDLNDNDMMRLFDRLNNLLLQQQIQRVKTYIIPIKAANNQYINNNFVPQIKGGYTAPLILRETYMLTRAYILLCSQTNSVDTKWFLDSMSRMGLLQTGEYAVLSLYAKTFASYYNATLQTSQVIFSTQSPLLSPFREPLIEEIFQSYRTALVLSEATTPPSSNWDKFQADISSYAGQPIPCPPFCNLPKYVKQSPLPTSTAILFESIIFYVRLVSQLIKENKTDITDGYALKQYFYSQLIDNTLSGVSIQIDGFSSALEKIIVSTAIIDKGTRGLFSIGTIQASVKDKTMRFRLNPNASFNWLNGNPPPPGPRCGFSGDDCPLKIKIKSWIISLLVTICVSIIFGFSVLYWRSKVREKKLRQASWKILRRNLLLFDLNKEDSRGSIGSSNASASITSSAATFHMHKSRRGLNQQDKGETSEVNPLIDQETAARRFNNIRGRRANRDWEYTSSFATALYQGALVGVKRIYKMPATVMTEEWRDEVVKIVSLKHDNLNSLIGMVFEQPLIFMISDYCQKGSLMDMVENDDIKLDNIFISSIVYDIINGLQYLHTNKKFTCHGRLKSTNCLIDSKWTLRLSEFGLFKFREGEERPLSEEEKCRKSLWTAPEILRGNSPQHTPQGDVYAVGIMLHEIFGREGPFADPLMDSVELIHLIKNPKPNEPLCRPDMRAVTEAPDFIRNVMKHCWEENPYMSPRISELADKCQPLKDGMSDNMLDNMLAMIQKYNNNLEELVSERTVQLEIEKEKADALLFAMLPKKAAETLKNGLELDPEHFDCVTLYFSDIVGFENIVRSHTAYQVMGFLHNIFARFDTLISQFDVYKVETIGDSYMAVSGLPVRNGQKHAGKIASMALRFMKEAKERKLKHPTGEMVQLRVGIHSGPVVAGVVGIKMPRYCLFGDTVNTTSRIESTGQGLEEGRGTSPNHFNDPLGLKIHCSAECRLYLDLLGGYETIERGLVSMKGKGEKLTYWLLSEDPSVRGENWKTKADQKGTEPRQ